MFLEINWGHILLKNSFKTLKWKLNSWVCMHKIILCILFWICIIHIIEPFSLKKSIVIHDKYRCDPRERKRTTDRRCDPTHEIVTANVWCTDASQWIQRMAEGERRGSVRGLSMAASSRRLAARCQGPRERALLKLYASSSACGRTRIYKSEGEGRSRLERSSWRSSIIYIRESPKVAASSRLASRPSATLWGGILLSWCDLAMRNPHYIPPQGQDEGVLSSSANDGLSLPAIRRFSLRCRSFIRKSSLFNDFTSSRSFFRRWLLRYARFVLYKQNSNARERCDSERWFKRCLFAVAYL